MSEQQLFAGLDVSTQSCKLILINFNEKSIEYLDVVNYDKDLPHYNTKNGARQNVPQGVSESDPLMWIEAINLLFQKLSDQFKQKMSYIKAISVSGQQHGLVTIQEDGQLSRTYSKLWNDFSTIEECEILTNQIGGKQAMIDEIYNTQRTGYTAPKILHMVRNEPDNFEKTRWVLLVHNYINYYLSGGVAAMEPGDVSGSALWNPKTREWSQKIIDFIHPKLQAKLPPVFECRNMIGKISQELREKFGFNQDCLIATGSGDNMMSAIGTGNVQPGILTISLGTSGTIFTQLEQVYYDEDGEIGNFCDATGNYLPLICLSNMANGFEEALKQYKLNYEQFEELVNQVEEGNNGKIICPWFTGERTPDLPQATPIYFGWQISDFTEKSICRGILEGHVLNLYQSLNKLPIKPTEIRLTGGISKSKAWRKTISNIFNCEVVPVLGEGAALGAALHGAFCYYKDMKIQDIIDGFIKLQSDEREFPQTELVERYKYIKRIYSAVSQRIRGIQSQEDSFQILDEYRKKFN